MVMQNGAELPRNVDFFEEDVDKVIGCTPVKLNELHAQYLRECISKIGKLKKLDAVEANHDRFNHCLAIYSTEPSLLDPVLSEFVGRLVKLIDIKRASKERFSHQTEEAFRFLKSLALVCHYKVIASLLSHEISFLEPLLSALEFYVNEIRDGKHVVYVLQIWLYIVCKNPFDFARLSKQSNLVGTGLDSLSQRLIKVLLRIQCSYNQDTSFYRLTPNLLAHILTRNKDNSAVLRPQLDQSFEILKNQNDNTLLRAHLSLLSSILKFGKRSELLAYAVEIFNNIKLSIFETSACYFAAKLYQRLTLVFLPPKLANWRYKRGYRSLEANLAMRKDENTVQVEDTKDELHVDQEDNDNEWDLSNLEKVLQMLEKFLLLLRHDTDDVRTTAAKALGRICVRLPKQQTDHVIQQVLQHNFSVFANASSWHGGCLALAELSGRGCFLPEHLVNVVPIICDALFYDRQCNGNVTEANVRDAACYICWSFARAYSLDVLRKHADLLAERLVCTALFDREVNVRRAASASFQENVGRHGGFSNGIQVLVIIDFIGVGKIRYCYESACFEVAQYTRYRRPILDHLCNVKCIYWDEKIRLLSAKAIERIAVLDSDYAFETAMPTLCNSLKTCDDFTEMQGYLLAIAAIVRGLANYSFGDLEVLRQVYDLILQHLAKFSQFSLKNFSCLIKASCVFIETVLNADLKLNVEKLIEFIGIAEHVLEKNNDSLRRCSSDALSSVFKYCCRHNHLQLLHSQMQKHLKRINNTNSEEQQIAYTLSLNSLPQEFFDTVDNGRQLFVDLLDGFADVILSPINSTWYVARISALESLTRLIQMSTASELINCDKIFDCLFTCINDRTKTDHGEVGRHVREAALRNMKTMLLVCINLDKHFEKHLDQSVANVLKRCFDGVDNTRATAIKTMLDLLNSDFHIKEADELRQVFTTMDQNVLNGIFFLPLEELLNLKRYRSHLLQGLIPSMGSILPWTAKHAQDILFRHTKPIRCNKTEMEAFVAELLEIGADSAKDESETKLFFNALQRMVFDRLFYVFEKDPDSSEVFVKLCEFVQTSSSKKAKQSLRHVLIRTLGAFLVINYDSEMGRKIRQKLVSFLASPYNSLRSMSAEQLVEALNLTNEQIFGRPHVQKAISMLNETNWNKQVQANEFKEVTLQIRDLLH